VIEAKTKELADMMKQKADGSYIESLKNDGAAAYSSGWNRVRLDESALSLLKPTEDGAEGDTDAAAAGFCNTLTQMYKDSSRSSSSSSSQKSKKTKTTTSAAASSSSSAEPASVTAYKKRLQSLALAEKDVAKLTKDRITQILVHPNKEKVFLLLLFLCFVLVIGAVHFVCAYITKLCRSDCENIAKRLRSV
jgi:cobalamin biosynthesis Mg chelatase CobN